MKLNTWKSRDVRNHAEATINKEGGLAFKLDAKTELYSHVMNCLMGEPKFYEEEADPEEKKIIELCDRVDPKFVLQLAVYARNKMNLRTIPQVLLGHISLAYYPVRKSVPKVVRRVDEFMDVISYIQHEVGDIGDRRAKGSLPSGLKRGLADAFAGFDEYQFSKYNNKSGPVKLRDVIRLVHPKPKNEGQAQLYRKIAKDELGPADTWEHEIMTEGSSQETWSKAVKVMPIMALIRNLRNLLKHDVDVTQAIVKLTDPDAIRHSKQFPFRFLSAFREVEKMGDGNEQKRMAILEALETAMDLSVSNLPKFEGITAAFADNSGSMTDKISSKSTVAREDIANMFLAICNKISKGGAITGIFGTDFRLKTMLPRNGVLSNARTIRNDEVGSSTNAFLVMHHLLKKKVKVDRIFLFSDMQCYDSGVDDFIQATTFGLKGNYNASDTNVAQLLRSYRKSINPNVFFYSFDLAGYGTAQVPQDDRRSVLFAGWSDKIFQYVPAFEESQGNDNPAIKEIESIEI